MSGFFKYLKAAFLYHWNLLMLGSTGAFGIISGYPDVVLPLAAAAEMVYLALLSSNPRFQKIVDAKEIMRHKTGRDEVSSKTVTRILNELNPADRKRFGHLQGLCQKLGSVADVVNGQVNTGTQGITDMQIGNINRLLWIYLKLLYSKKSLENYFATIDEKEIKEKMNGIQERLNSLGNEAEDTPTEVKYRRSLADTYNTHEMRLKNYSDAKGNYDFIQLELERLYSKIAGIAETGISRQDPQYVSNEIDIVSSSVMQTEKTMNDLGYLTGVTLQDEEPPSFLRKDRDVLTND